MESYKSSQRKFKLQEKKKVKQHLKEFYKGLGNMEAIAVDLRKLDVIFTEDNLQEYVTPLLGRDLDSMEKFVLLGKLNYKQELDEARDNIK
jgi:hypothetical protein